MDDEHNIVHGTEITCLLEEELWHQKHDNMKPKLQNMGTAL
jgi:hypothetical protein